MGDHRRTVFNSVQAALGPLQKRVEYPQYEVALSVSDGFCPQDDLWTAFAAQFTRVHGRAMDAVSELGEFLRQAGWRHGYCDPALAGAIESDLGPGLTLEAEFDRSRIDTYEFGITEAVGAIAESGTLILDDTTTSARLAALAPWVHVACLRRDRIYGDIPTAVERFRDDPCIIWVTGPSKTADIEGILIEGVHGPGIQICLLLP